MAPNSLNVEMMLRAAFLETEVAFLKRQPAFVDALAEVRTTNDFEGLCQLAEELLGAYGRMNPAAPELRKASRRDTSASSETE